MFIIYLSLSYFCFSSNVHASPLAQCMKPADQDTKISTQQRSLDARNQILPIDATASSLPLNATTQNLVWNAATYRRYIQKGISLYSRLQGGCMPDKEKPPTVTDLMHADWNISPFPARSMNRSSSGLLVDVLDAIGAGEGEDYFFMNAINEQTHSIYHSSYSPVNGMLGAVDSRHMVNDPVFWSDVAFAMWTHLCDFTRIQPANLKYLVQAYVSNDITLSIVNQAIPQHSGMFMLTPDGDLARGFFALLASPNGAGGVHLLMQHKAALGRKTVTKIAVWKEGDQLPDIVYEIGEVGIGAHPMVVGGHMAYACGPRNASLDSESDGVMADS